MVFLRPQVKELPALRRKTHEKTNSFFGELSRQRFKTWVLAVPSLWGRIPTLPRKESNTRSQQKNAANKICLQS